MNYLEIIYSNSYHKMEVTLIGLSGLKLTSWKNRINTQDMKKFTHSLIICGGKDACNHPRKQLLKSKKPSEITKAMNEWVESIAHRQILVLPVLPRKLR